MAWEARTVAPPPDAEFLLRRTRYQTRRPTASARPTTPPTTAPAMTPLKGVEVSSAPLHMRIERVAGTDALSLPDEDGAAEAEALADDADCWEPVDTMD